MTNKFLGMIRSKRRWASALMLLSAAGTSTSAQNLQWQPAPPLPTLSGTKVENVVAEPLLWERVPETPQQSKFTTETEQNNSSIPSSAPSTALVWELVQPSHHASTDDFMAMLSFPGTDSNTNTNLVWKLVEPDQVIVIEENPQKITQDATEAIKLARRALDEASPTYSSTRALWRNERWLPQISYLVPNGYGPYGVMFDVSVTGTDCTLGKGPCESFTTFEAWQKSLDTQANGSTYFNLGIGNTQTWGGIFVTNSAETISGAIGRGDGQLVDNDRILQGVQTGLHYSKAIGPDTSFRTGVENLITWDSQDFTFSDMTRNFYFVGSQRLRLKPSENQSPWFRNLYLTAGIGNGEFKPIEQTFQDQTQALKDAGCATYGFTPTTPCSNERFKRALRTGSDYGQLNPIASIAIEALDGLHIIGEWSGRNLNAGLSWRPFNEFGLVITPMIESIVSNCEYPGCRVTPIDGYPDRVPLPDAVLTERTRLSLQASLQIKF